MKRPDEWTPSAALAAATLAALHQLARHWKHAMAVAFDTTEDGNGYFADFAFALKDADLRAIPMAARQWVATNEMPPKPAGLGAVAMDVTRQHFPKAPPPPTILPPVSDGPNVSRVSELQRRALKTLGSYALSSLVWEKLIAAAPDPETRHAIRAGTVSDEVFNAAVQSVLRA